MSARRLDYAASATLTKIRELIGEELTVKLVVARGGTDVWLPTEATADCALAAIVGAEAAAKLVEGFGGYQKLLVPTGKGYGHGRVIDRRRVRELKEFGRKSNDEIAREMGCTERQVRNILNAKPHDDERQGKLF